MNKKKPCRGDGQTETEAAETLLLLRRESDRRKRWLLARGKDRAFLYPQPPYPGWHGMHPPAFPFDYSNMRFFPFMPPPYFAPQGPRPWFPAPQLCLRQPPPGMEYAGLGPPSSLPQQFIYNPQPVVAQVEECVDQMEAEQDDQRASPPNDKRKRRNLTKRQQNILESAYSSVKYPTFEVRLQLEQSTQLSEDRIQVWFQNRRAKDKRIQEASNQIPHGLELDFTHAQCLDGAVNDDDDVEESDIDEPMEKRFKNEGTGCERSDTFSRMKDNCVGMHK